MPPATDVPPYSRQLPPVHPGQPRETVQVRFPDGRILEGPRHAPLEAFIAAMRRPGDPPVVSAIVEGKLVELAHPVEHEIDVEPISIRHSDGTRIYQRSLCFLLIVAAHELFPEALIHIDYSLTLNGLYCRVEGRDTFSKEDLEQLESHMRALVQADLPIVKKRISLEEAREIFEQQGYLDKIRLLVFRQKGYLKVYGLRGLYDYFYGHMVPSTGYLHLFALQPYPPGFILRFPRRSQPGRLPPFRDSPKLAAVFEEYGEWMDFLEVKDVAGLNRAIAERRIREVILVAEALHAQRVTEIAQEIARQRESIRLVLIAGPSSAGKTTFTKRLAVQLLANGIRPLPIGLDDYFVPRAETPRDEEGQFDYEILEAIDLELFNEQLLALLEGREIRLPHYNFISGLREEGPTLSLQQGQVLLIEGLHGLNPRLVPRIPPASVYRVYVSALTQLNLDWHNRVPTTDTRLLRRLVRDARDRGYSAHETITRWEKVRRGETRNIFIYQENADCMFNSALVYELAVLKPLAEPLLRQIEPGTLPWVEARRLLAFLEWFLPCPPDLIPDNSLLREFIGGSILRDFRF
ncbi:MAG: nucleoside kinase [Chloroflexia bacterium]|nr:nucleoside kinase [Chloroflexia bacterium]